MQIVLENVPAWGRDKQDELLGSLLEFVVDDLHQGSNRLRYNRSEELNIEGLIYSHFLPLFNSG